MIVGPHFRQHYCEDALLDKQRQGPGLSRAQFLEQMKFPHATDAPGPSIRSGDFAEILIADYVEFKLGPVKTFVSPGAK
jgi:hypothetical protein